MQFVTIGLAAGLAGAIQASLLWAAGRGLEILEQTSRFYYRASRVEEANSFATREHLEEISRNLDGLSRALAVAREAAPADAHAAEDDRFKLMTPEEAERMFGEAD